MSIIDPIVRGLLREVSGGTALLHTLDAFRSLDDWNATITQFDAKLKSHRVGVEKHKQRMMSERTTVSLTGYIERRKKLLIAEARKLFTSVDYVALVNNALHKGEDWGERYINAPSNWVFDNLDVYEQGQLFSLLRSEAGTYRPYFHPAEDTTKLHATMWMQQSRVRYMLVNGIFEGRIVVNGTMGVPNTAVLPSDEVWVPAHKVRERVASGAFRNVIPCYAPRAACISDNGVYYTPDSLVDCVHSNGTTTRELMPDAGEYVYEPHLARFVHISRLVDNAPNFFTLYKDAREVRISQRPSYHNRQSREGNSRYVRQVEAARVSYMRMYGAEIEVVFKSSRLRDMWIARHKKEAIALRGTIFERDGSLPDDTGLEIITAPYTLADLHGPNTSPVRAIFDSVADALEPNTRCGLHINCSAAGTGRWLRERMSTMINELRPLFEVLARRESNNYAVYSEIAGTPNATRYAAVSDRGAYTELRMFRGATTEQEVLEAVELADALHVWCDHPLMPVTRAVGTASIASEFRAWVRRNGSRWPTLSARLGGVETSVAGYEKGSAIEQIMSLDSEILWPAAFAANTSPYL